METRFYRQIFCFAPCFLFFLLLLAGFLSFGCSSGSSSANDEELVKAPFGPPTDTTTFVFIRMKNGSSHTVSGGKTGTKVIDRITYKSYQLFDDTSGNARGTEVWMNWTPNEVTFAGGIIYWPDNGIVPPDEPFATGTMDNPLLIDLYPPVGVPQTLVIKGTAILGDPETSTTTYSFDNTGAYTLVDDKATVTSSIGTISNARKFNGSLTAYGVTANLTGYYHPDYGLIKADLDWPPPDGTKVDLFSITDYGIPVEGYNTIAAMSVIGPGNPIFRLDTYEVNQDFDADKETHALMLLEFRWLDEEKAKSEDKPYVTPEFGTAAGIFSYDLVGTKTSFFHPEDNDKGYTFWMAYVSQAAKNEPVNGISYHISITLDSFITSQLQVTARIRYKLYQP